MKLVDKIIKLDDGVHPCGKGFLGTSFMIGEGWITLSLDEYYNYRIMWTTHKDKHDKRASKAVIMKLSSNGEVVMCMESNVYKNTMIQCVTESSIEENYEFIMKKINQAYSLNIT